MAKFLKKWNPKTLPKREILYILAPKRSGKISLILTLYLDYLERKYDYVIVLAGNPDCASEYRKILPGKYVHDRYHPDILKKFFNASDVLVKKSGKKSLPSVFFILDDTLRMRKTDKTPRTTDDPYIHRLFTEHRHYNCGLAICTQNIAAGTTSFIRGCDCFLTCPSSLSNGSDIDLIAKNYMGNQRYWETNYEILDQFKKFEFLVITQPPGNKRTC